MSNFRVWNKWRHEYIKDLDDVCVNVSGEIITDMSSESGNFEVHDTDEMVLERYTGLKDIYGTKIYENDIVQPVQAFGAIPDVIKPVKIGLAFAVTLGNYIYGKWIASHISKNSAVKNKYFSDGLVIVGNTNYGVETEAL